MICIDTNIAIYIAQKKLDDTLANAGPVLYASIVKIETLGYQNILSAEERNLRNLFGSMVEIPLGSAIIDRAVALRQAQKMSLGDAIIAATALEQDCPLWTANTGDFSDIAGLRLHNPFTPVK